MSADRLALDAFGFASAGQAPAICGEERVVGEDALLVAKDLIFRVRPHHLAEHARPAIAIGHQQVDHHEGVGILEWQRLEQEPVDEREDCGVGANTECQRRHGDQGEERRPGEGAQRIADVLTKTLHGLTPGKDVVCA